MPFLLCFLLLGTPLPGADTGDRGGSSDSPPTAALDPRPLRFEPNLGQAPEEVRFLARGSGYTMFLGATASTLSLAGQEDGKPAWIRCEFVGASPDSDVAGATPLPGKSNYLIGNDPKGWMTGIPTFARVEYEEVYPGIDLVYYGSDGALEYDFVVAPGADPARIEMAVDGARNAEISSRGDLLLHTAAGVLRWKKPLIYQVAEGERHIVDGAFRLDGERIRFRVGEYDETLALVIDPVLDYATYFGGSSNEAARGLALDAEHNIYIAGFTQSTNLPVTGDAVQQSFAGRSGYWMGGDAFVTKLSADGTEVLYSTYLGGGRVDFGIALAVDGSGCAYLTGYTNSTDFPTTVDAFQKTYQGGDTFLYLPGGGDAFVAKIDPDGGGLVYSTYLGGSKDDRGMAIAVNTAGEAYVTGGTLSTDFPVTAGVYSLNYSGNGGAPPLPGDSGTGDSILGDVFVTKLNSIGSGVVASTYLGGAKDEAAGGIVVVEASDDNTPVKRSMPTGSSDYVYVTGATLSTDFPVTAGAYQTQHQGSDTVNLDVMRFGDGFVTKMTGDLSTLMYSTLLGGGRDDQITDLFVDSSGNAYLTGSTTSTDFPVTENAFQPVFGGSTPAEVSEVVFGDAFVAKLSPEGDDLTYSTYLGGSQDDAGWGITVDAAGRAFVTGHTLSDNWPLTEDTIQDTYGGEDIDEVIRFGDAFITGLRSDGTELVFSSYLGGSGDDIGGAIALDETGAGYVAGSTNSTDFPTTQGVVRQVFGGNTNTSLPRGDAFVVKLAELTSPQVEVTIASVGNAASYEQGGVAPGEIVILLGTNIGPETIVQLEVENGIVTTTLGETRVLFDETPAPLVYVWNGATSAIVPYDVAGKETVDVVVEYQGIRSAPLSVPVLASHPGLFSYNASGQGGGAILNQNYSVNTASNPAAPGSIVMLYGTGEGQTDPEGVDGLLATEVYPAPLLPVSVTIGGIDAGTLHYAGAAPYMVAGVFQINVTVPAGLAPGNYDVVVTIGGASSRTGLTLAVGQPAAD